MDNNFLTNLSENNKDLIFCVASLEYKEMARNWFLHLKNIGLDNQSIVMCLDYDILNYLKQHNVNCMYYADNIINSVTVEQIKGFYIPNHELKCVLIMENLFRQYNFNIYLFDVDMIFIKNPLPYILSILKEEDDGCFFQNIDFEETISNENSIMGNIIFYKKTVYNKILNLLNKKISIDMNNLNFNNIKNIFNLNLTLLNKYKFIHSTFLEVDSIKNMLFNSAYCVHYADTVDKEFKYKSKENLFLCINKKINDMKKNNHWII